MGDWDTQPNETYHDMLLPKCGKGLCIENHD